MKGQVVSNSTHPTYYKLQSAGDANVGMVGCFDAKN